MCKRGKVIGYLVAFPNSTCGEMGEQFVLSIRNDCNYDYLLILDNEENCFGPILSALLEQ